MSQDAKGLGGRREASDASFGSVKEGARSGLVARALGLESYTLLLEGFTILYSSENASEYSKVSEVGLVFYCFS